MRASVLLLLTILLGAVPSRADEPAIDSLTKTLREQPNEALAVTTAVAALNRFTSAQAFRILEAMPPGDRLEALRQLSPKLDDGLAREKILALFPAGKERDEAATLVPVPPRPGPAPTATAAPTTPVAPPPAAPGAPARRSVPGYERGPEELLVDDLRNASGRAEMLEVLTTYVRTQPTSFDRYLVWQILGVFHFDAKAVEPLRVIEPRIVPMLSHDMHELLKQFEPGDRLPVFRVLRDTLAEPANKGPVLSTFPAADLAEATAIVAEARQRSLIYGTVRAPSVVFLVDTSGSMSARSRDGSPVLTRVVRELGEVVAHGLPEKTTFAIGAFETRLRAWSQRLEAPTDTTRASASAFLESLRPDGGTMLLPALEWALKLGPAEVHVLSDGMPGDDTEALVKLVEKAAANGTVVHAAYFGRRGTFAKGSERMSGYDFMQRLATVGHGTMRTFE